MFSFRTLDGRLALQLSDDQHVSLIRKEQATQTVQHGQVMQEFVDISAVLWKKKSVIAELFDDSFRYTSMLKPKAAKKKAGKKER